MSLFPPLPLEPGKITRIDIQRLLRLLEGKRIRVGRMEIRSADDLDPEMLFANLEQGGRVGPDGSPAYVYGIDLTIHPSFPVGLFRVLPESKYSVQNIFAEWNVQEWGPVPEKIDFDGEWVFKSNHKP